MYEVRMRIALICLYVVLMLEILGVDTTSTCLDCFWMFGILNIRHTLKEFFAIGHNGRL